MTGVPDHFVHVIRRLPARFSRTEAARACPQLKESTLVVYLSHLVRAGLLERRGPRLFERVDEPEIQVPLPRHLRMLADTLETTLLPSAKDHVIAWGAEDLAPLLHDAILDPFLVVEAPKPTLETIRHALSNDWTVHRVDRRPRLGTVIWHNTNAARDRPDVFLVPNTSLKGSKATGAGIRLPTPERLLLDVLHIPAIMPQAALEVLRTLDFDPDASLALAGERGRSAEVASFLTWATLTVPDLPARGRLEARFPHLAYKEAA